MARYEFEGRSAAEAAIKACEELGVTRSALRYDVVSESGEGIDRRVVIAVERDANATPAATSGGERTREGGRDGHTGSGDREERRGHGDRGRRERGGRSDRSERGDRPDRGELRRGRDRHGDRDRGDRGLRRPKRGVVPQEADDGFEALLRIEDFPNQGVARPELIGDISAKALRAKTVLNDVLARMHFDASGIIVQDDAHEIHLDIRGNDAKRVIGKKGEPLLSMQFLVNRMVSQENELEPVVVLDVAGYRERRRAALAELARKLAQRAMDEHKVVKLSPMSAHDRRVFHLTLTELGGVTTQSEGEGLFRRLLIIPAEFTSGGAGT